MTERTPHCRFAAGCTAVMAWAVAAGSASTEAASPYLTLVVGTAVLASLVAAVEVRRTGRFEARLAAAVVAVLVVGAQLLVATLGAPSSAGRWTFAGVVVRAYGGCVPRLLVLASRARATGSTRRRHPYAR